MKKLIIAAAALLAVSGIAIAAGQANAKPPPEDCPVVAACAR